VAVVSSIIDLSFQEKKLHRPAYQLSCVHSYVMFEWTTYRTAFDLANLLYKWSSLRYVTADGVTYQNLAVPFQKNKKNLAVDRSLIWMLASLDRFASPLGYAWILCLFVLLKFSLR
jgi:hypothetical protein